MIKKWIHNLLKKEERNDVNLDIVQEAITDYRQEGKELMFKLGEKYGLDIGIKEDYEKLISRSNKNIPRRGELSKRWNYNFHIGGCRFYNKKHQKKVEVVLTNSPEFGHIDSWFLLSYMQSVDKYKSEVEGMDRQNLKLVVEKLYMDNKIKKVE
ncbi:hypothetical protein NBT05_07730 [Aquimarina sp. ERC-38]|uniref:DUF6896 domain-containing protein n=1 Tax=Aquimarina sp. ERC-38 TaxID=2949996 RepID=UPI0022476863|nr:hypothetical protein [Aquimarina sp. ERC-38]UZO82354.1 hypothetical protein NBT05_07730 [Aquimarina sp. ERC-38]